MALSKKDQPLHARTYIFLLWAGWVWTLLYLGPPDASSLPRYDELTVIEAPIVDVAWGERGSQLYDTPRRRSRGKLALVVNLDKEHRIFPVMDTQDHKLEMPDGQIVVTTSGTRSLSEHIGKLVTIRGERKQHFLFGDSFDLWEVAVGDTVFYSYQFRLNNTLGKKSADLASTVQTVWFFGALIASAFLFSLTLTVEQKERIRKWLS